jgi:S-phase kinase-associated protein 1
MGLEVATAQPVLLLNVTQPVLEKIVEWCKHHRDDPPLPKIFKSESRIENATSDDWDQKYLEVDQEML